MKSSIRVLHIFLIVIVCIVIITTVNANDHNSPFVGIKNGKTVALEAKQIRLSHLQFDKTQPYVKINGEMSQKGKTPPEGISKMVNITQIPSETTIPYGTIVHHSHGGVTTIFDANGKQLFAAKDTDAKKVATPFGFVPATFVNEVPDNSVIYDDNNGTIHVFYNDSRILTITGNTDTDNGVAASFIPTSGEACLSLGYPIQYIEGTETQSIPSVGQFTAPRIHRLKS